MPRRSTIASARRLVRAMTADVSIPAPPGWIASEVLELANERLGAHVIVSVEPVRPGVTADELSRAYARTLEALPEYEELGAEHGSPERTTRKLAWTPHGGRRVAQLQLYAVDGARAYVATATTQRERFAALEPQLRALLRSIVEPALSQPTFPAVIDTGAVDDEFDHVETTSGRTDARRLSDEHRRAWIETASSFGEPSAPGRKLSAVSDSKGVST